VNNTKLQFALIFVAATGLAACQPASSQKTAAVQPQSDTHCAVKAVQNAADLSRFKNDCLSRANCQYIAPEPCYCPPKITCICGGGQGPRCKVKIPQ